MSVLPLLSWTVLLLVQTCSSSSDPPSKLQPLSLTVQPHHQLLPDAASGSHCPSCALARMRRNEGVADDMAGHDQEGEAAQQDVVEAVKRHILNMLHLQARPNITRPVPRAALLNALRKLHVGRVAEDGSVQIEGEEDDPKVQAIFFLTKQRKSPEVQEDPDAVRFRKTCTMSLEKRQNRR